MEIHERLGSRQQVQIDQNLLQDLQWFHEDLLAEITMTLERERGLKGRGVSVSGMTILKTIHAEMKRRQLGSLRSAPGRPKRDIV